MNFRDLELWAIQAAQELQGMVADAEESVAPEEQENVMISAKTLLAEFDAISKGRPTSMDRMAAMPNEDCPMLLRRQAG